jgi:hypothetical protein
MPNKGDFPLRENCDPTDPEEAFLWMFVAPPKLNGAPLMMPIEYYRLMSKRLWDLGCRPTEEPTLAYVPPTAADPHWATAPGNWVAAKDYVPDPDAEYKRGLAKMGHAQKVMLYKALKADAAGTPDASSLAGKVVAGSTAEQKATLLRLLEAENNT